MLTFCEESTCSVASTALLSFGWAAWAVSSGAFSSWAHGDGSVRLVGFVCDRKATRGRPSIDYRVFECQPMEKTVNTI